MVGSSVGGTGALSSVPAGGLSDLARSAAALSYIHVYVPVGGVRIIAKKTVPPSDASLRGLFDITYRVTAVTEEGVAHQEEGRGLTNRAALAQLRTGFGGSHVRHYVSGQASLLEALLHGVPKAYFHSLNPTQGASQ